MIKGKKCELNRDVMDGLLNMFDERSFDIVNQVINRRAIISKSQVFGDAQISSLIEGRVGRKLPFGCHHNQNNTTVFTVHFRYSHSLQGSCFHSVLTSAIKNDVN